MGGQGLPRDLPLQESGRVLLQHRAGLRSVALSRGSVLNLPNKVQEGAVPIRIPLGRVRGGRVSSRYVTLFSINVELTGNGSARGASKLANVAPLCQTALANNARPGRWGAV